MLIKTRRLIRVLRLSAIRRFGRRCPSAEGYWQLLIRIANYKQIYGCYMTIDELEKYFEQPDQIFDNVPDIMPKRQQNIFKNGLQKIVRQKSVGSGKSAKAYRSLLVERKFAQQHQTFRNLERGLSRPVMKGRICKGAQWGLQDL